MGVLLGVAAKGRNGEVIINNLVSVEVPLAVTQGIKKAVGTAKTAGKATASTVGSGLDWAKNQAKSELSNAGKELSVFGKLDLENELNDDHKSILVNALRDGARKRSGKSEMSDVPEVDGNPSYGASASNSNINAALKMVGIGAFLPTGGDTGAYVYLNDKTKEVSGFAVSLKWTIGGK